MLNVYESTTSSTNFKVAVFHLELWVWSEGNSQLRGSSMTRCQIECESRWHQMFHSLRVGTEDASTELDELRHLLSLNCKTYLVVPFSEGTPCSALKTPRGKSKSFCGYLEKGKPIYSRRGLAKQIGDWLFGCTKVVQSQQVQSLELGPPVERFE